MRPIEVAKNSATPRGNCAARIPSALLLAEASARTKPAANQRVTRKRSTIWTVSLAGVATSALALAPPAAPLGVPPVGASVAAPVAACHGITAATGSSPFESCAPARADNADNLRRTSATAARSPSIIQVRSDTTGDTTVNAIGASGFSIAPSAGLSFLLKPNKATVDCSGMSSAIRNPAPTLTPGVDRSLGQHGRAERHQLRRSIRSGLLCRWLRRRCRLFGPLLFWRPLLLLVAGRWPKHLPKVTGTPSRLPAAVPAPAPPPTICLVKNKANMSVSAALASAPVCSPLRREVTQRLVALQIFEHRRRSRGHRDHRQLAHRPPLAGAFGGLPRPPRRAPAGAPNPGVPGPLLDGPLPGGPPGPLLDGPPDAGPPVAGPPGPAGFAVWSALGFSSSLEPVVGRINSREDSPPDAPNCSARCSALGSASPAS